MAPLTFDLLVIGGGHAGCEAAAVAARRGLHTGLILPDRKSLAKMSCNPSVGGIGKGHLVREIDALGGLMAKVADLTCIQFRLLNSSKGPAVQGIRCQSDRELYSFEMARALGAIPNLQILEGEALRLVVECGRATGVEATPQGRISTRAVVLAAGTFLGGMLHFGMEQVPGGRVGEFSSSALSEDLFRLGLALGRLKTGTPPRLRRESIDFSNLAP